MRPSIFLAAVLALSASLAGAQPAKPIQPASVSRTTSTYTCNGSPLGECAFLLYASDCKEAGVRNGSPSLVCTHSLFAEFTLKTGETKTFQDLPAGVKQCQPRDGKLAFPDCMR